MTNWPSKRTATGLVVFIALSGSCVGAAASLSGSGNASSARLVFVRATNSGVGLFSVNADGRGLKRLTSGSDEAPAWSSDGLRLAFSRTRNQGRTYEIYTATAAGRHLRAITRGGGFAQSPAWAPSGRLIVFSASGGHFGRSTDASCAPNVWVVRPDGSGLRRLLSRGIQPAYSPDGRQLAFVRPDSHERSWVYIVGANGNGARRIGIGSHPSWSPDGHRVVVERGEGPNRMSDLWSLQVSDARARRLTHTSALAELAPDWSRNGGRIAFSMVRNGRQDIYWLSASGGSPHAITHTSRNAGNYDPAWQPS